MKINKLKEVIISGFNKWNESRKNKLDIKIYELFYLIIYDLIFILILYLFIFKSTKAGIAKIIMQILKCFFTARRFKENIGDIKFYNLILNHFDNSDLRNSDIFTPEVLEIFEFLFDFVIILDIIWLIIIIKESLKNNNYNSTETKKGIKKQVLTKENRVDYKEEGTIELKEKKIYSNKNNKESDDDKGNDKDDDKDNNNNINNKDDDDNDNNNDNQNDSYNQNGKENDKHDEEINNNKYDEDNEDINNNKNKDDAQDNNSESNENNYNNYKNSEVNKSFKDKEENEDEKNNEEEKVLDANQETT